jgi:hypothetical protein
LTDHCLKTLLFTGGLIDHCLTSTFQQYSGWEQVQQ